MDIRLLQQLNIHFLLIQLFKKNLILLSFIALVVPQFEHNKTPLL